jgi:hypothetical protein
VSTHTLCFTDNVTHIKRAVEIVLNLSHALGESNSQNKFKSCNIPTSGSMTKVKNCSQQMVLKNIGIGWGQISKIQVLKKKCKEISIILSSNTFYTLSTK